MNEPDGTLVLRVSRGRARTRLLLATLIMLVGAAEGWAGVNVSGPLDLQLHVVVSLLALALTAPSCSADRRPGSGHPPGQVLR